MGLRVRLAEEEPQRGRYETPVAIDLLSLPLERKVADLSAPVAELLRDARGRIRTASGTALFRRVEKRLCRSEGTDIEQMLMHASTG